MRLIIEIDDREVTVQTSEGSGSRTESMTTSMTTGGSAETASIPAGPSAAGVSTPGMSDSRSYPPEMEEAVRASGAASAGPAPSAPMSMSMPMSAAPGSPPMPSAESGLLMPTELNGESSGEMGGGAMSAGAAAPTLMESS